MGHGNIRENNRRTSMLLWAAAFVCVLLTVLLWTVEYCISRAAPSGTAAADPGTSAIEETAGAPSVKLSHSPGYYGCGIRLEMYPPEGYDVIYTVTLSLSRNQPDGRSAQTGEPYFYSGGIDPDPGEISPAPEKYDTLLFNSRAGRFGTYLYSGPLELYNPNDYSPMVASIKAMLYKDGAAAGPAECFTYIIGGPDDSRSFEDWFGSMLIVLTVDEKLLYDYETGIFILGKQYDDAIAAGIQQDPWTPRNYNQRGKEWERLAHADFFDQDGRLVLSELCGMRVAGGTSRGASLKSLKLSADDHTGSGRFDYPFFEGAKDSQGRQITSFKKLILRNPANDIGGSLIRDQFLHKLGGSVGVDYQEGRNAVVYMNGKYYGLMCLHESLDADYQEDHYFVNPDNVAAFLIRSDQFQFRYKQESGTPEMFDYFISDMDYLIKNDFSARSIDLIREVIDVENFCRYMAYQLYIVNEDWPHNNVLVWRYYGPENSSVEAMDGRWRFVLKDLDIGFNSPEKDNFAACLNDGLYGGEPCIGQVLRNLLRNSEFKAIFRQTCLEVAEQLTPEYVIGMVDDAVDEIAKDAEMFSFYYGFSYQGWLAYSDNFRDFASRRGEYYLRYLDIYAPADKD